LDFSATVRPDITKNYEVEQNLVAVMEGDVLILASTANFNVGKTFFFVRKQKRSGGRFKKMCVRRKKQVDLLTLILPFHIDYILRLFLFLAVVTQQQIFYRCICFLLIIVIAKEYLCRQNKISGCAVGMSLDIKGAHSEIR